MEEWIFNGNTPSYLDFCCSDVNIVDLEAYTAKDIENCKLRPADYIEYIGALKVIKISGDPASIAITAVHGTPCIVRSIGAPRQSPSITAEGLISKIEKVKLEECIYFEPIKPSTRLVLWVWSPEEMCYTAHRFGFSLNITVNSAITYMQKDSQGWYLITLLVNHG
jgi:hypothetical protein